MKLGDWGEAAALAYLRKLGYQICERNFRCRMGELDLIAMDGSTIVFVEVKTRRSLACGLPCESITSKKQMHIRRTAFYYLASIGVRDQDLRIDVIEVIRKNNTPYIRHLINAF